MDEIEQDIVNTEQQDDGENYREIAQILTDMGHQMNHSSARNYMIRAMKKFVSAYAKMNGIKLKPDAIESIARSSSFQNGIADILSVKRNK